MVQRQGPTAADNYNMLINLTGGGGGAGANIGPSGGKTVFQDTKGADNRIGSGLDSMDENKQIKIMDPLKITPFGIVRALVEGMQGAANQFSLASLVGNQALGLASLGNLSNAIPFNPNHVKSTIKGKSQ